MFVTSEKYNMKYILDYGIDLNHNAKNVGYTNNK